MAYVAYGRNDNAYSLSRHTSRHGINSSNRRLNITLKVPSYTHNSQPQTNTRDGGSIQHDKYEHDWDVTRSSGRRSRRCNERLYRRSHHEGEWVGIHLAINHLSNAFPFSIAGSTKRDRFLPALILHFCPIVSRITQHLAHGRTTHGQILENDSNTASQSTKKVST